MEEQEEDSEEKAEGEVEDEGRAFSMERNSSFSCKGRGMLWK